MRVLRVIVAAAMLSIVVSAPASAQGWTPPDPAFDPWNTASMKIGPLFVKPSFDLRDVGVDNNVFRDPQLPAQDLTATIAVATIFGVHMGPFSLAVTQDNRYLWFRKYTSERSIDGGLRAIAELRTQRMRPWISGSNLKSHDRSGFEIDSRAGRSTPTFEVGTDMNFGLRTGMTVAFKRSRTLYTEGEFFDDVDLKEALDNEDTFVNANGKWRWTEFTHLVGGVQWNRTEFLRNPLRSGETYSYFAGFQTSSDAPIAGNFRLGFKHQDHEDPNVRDFKSVVFNGSVGTVVYDRVRLDLVGDRDISYSYDDDFPFYLQQGGGVTLTYRVGVQLDLIGSAKAEWLDYSETFIEADRPLPDRTDLATVFGVGFLYRMSGAGSQFGLTLERAQRTSPIDRKNYNNQRVLTNIRFSF